MLGESISYPHPVIGLADDVSGLFSVAMGVERNPNTRSIEFRATYKIIDNNYFLSLIESKKAGLLIKMYCSSTFMTRTFISPETVISISEDDVCNKVEIEPFIIALEDISEYQDESFNEEYGAHIFSVEKYDIIGLVGPIIVPIDKKYEKLGLGNIFEFVPEDGHNTPCSFDFNTDKIIIKYPTTQSGDHPPNALFNKAAWTSYNIFIVPALTEAFRLMSDKEKSGEFEDKEWFYVLNILLPIEERSNDPFKSSQLLINKEIPVLKAFEELCNG